MKKDHYKEVKGYIKRRRGFVTKTNILLISAILLIGISIGYSFFSTPLKIKGSVVAIREITTYTVIFNSNGGTDGTMLDQEMYVDDPVNLRTNTFTRTDYDFVGWNTLPDGNGTYYRDAQEVCNINGGIRTTVTLYAQWVSQGKVAEINETQYTNLQAAINAVPTTGAQTTIKLLRNTSETLTIAAGKNIVFNLQNYTVSNKNNNPVITNNGTLTITNGTITSSANQGAINNEATGIIYMSGGKIQATGTRQAIYNWGRVEISGNAYLSSVTAERAPLHNLATGTAIITGGTILSTGFYGIENLGTLTIGNKNGTVNENTPLIKGETYGVYTTPTFDFYDGIIEGKTDAVNDELLIDDIETETEILHARDGDYKKISLGLKVTIAFNVNANDASVDEPSREISMGSAIGTLPIPTRPSYDFIGWFTDSNPYNGTEVHASTIFNSDTEIFAHWTESQIYVAAINGTRYQKLQDAIDAVDSNDSKVVITILKDINDENLIISSGQNIEFDIGSYTISNTSGCIFDNSGTIEIKNGIILRNGDNDQYRVIENKKGANLIISGGDIKSNVFQVIRNYGTASITGGKIWGSNAVDQGIVNNENGARLTVSGGQIIATKRQAIYNDGGTLTISGSVYLINGSGTAANRACVHNHKGTTTISGGTIISPAAAYPAVLNETTMTISGGTIKSTVQNGVNNTGTLSIGIKGGSVSTTSPSITGNVYGVNNTKTLKFYDGILKGKTAAISGSIAETEPNYEKYDDTEIIDGYTYYTAYLVEE